MATAKGPVAQGLKSYEFRKEREARWRALENLVNQVEKRGLRSLTPDELARLPVLYRATLSSLSVARSISLDRNVVEYLEALAARAYFAVYGSRRSAFETLRWFVVEGFPRAVRQAAGHLGLATLFFLAGGITAFALVTSDPSYYDAFVDPAYASGRDPSATTESLREGLFDGGDAAGEGLGVFASFLFSHNAQIGILCFALGFAAGVPVFLLLFMNGLLLGAFAALYHGRGLSVELWSWLLPHGVTEILALLLCGAAGLLLADGLLFPGRTTRIASLREKGRLAGLIVVGCIAMDFVAALLEAFFRQGVQSVPLRYSIVLVSVVFWLVYLLRAGRRTEP